MTIGTLILLLVVVGVVLWLVPMDGNMRNIIAAIVGIIALVVVLRYAGLL